MICQNCGKEIDSNALFCKYCGFDLKRNKRERKKKNILNNKKILIGFISAIVILIFVIFANLVVVQFSFSK